MSAAVSFRSLYDRVFNQQRGYMVTLTFPATNTPPPKLLQPARTQGHTAKTQTPSTAKPKGAWLGNAPSPFPCRCCDKAILRVHINFHGGRKS